MASVGWNVRSSWSSRVYGPSSTPRLPRHQSSFPPSSRAPFSALRASSQDQQSSSTVDVSVFRFTLGIPGFDDSDLPRVLGVTFGAVLVLNHFLTADYITAAQWRSELIGLCNAVFSISLPSIGRSLNGGGRIDAATSMPKSRQIFALSKNLSLEEKEELAWGSYVLLKNTRATSLVIWNEQLMCTRGLWDIPNEANGDVMEWLERILKNSSLFTFDRLTYTPFKADNQGWDFIPTGIVCSVVIPSDWSTVEETNLKPKVRNVFILLLSSTPNAFSQKDLLWIQWLAKKLLKSRSLSCHETKV